MARARKKPGKEKPKPSPIERVKDITVSLTGVIPTGSFANMRPGLSMSVTPRAEATPQSVFAHVRGIIINEFAIYQFGIDTPFQKPTIAQTVAEEFDAACKVHSKQAKKKKKAKKKHKKGVKK